MVKSSLLMTTKAKHSKENLCDTCTDSIAQCFPEIQHFGDNIGNDNIIECSGYIPKKKRLKLFWLFTMWAFLITMIIFYLCSCTNALSIENKINVILILPPADNFSLITLVKVYDEESVLLDILYPAQIDTIQAEENSTLTARVYRKNSQQTISTIATKNLNWRF